MENEENIKAREASEFLSKYCRTHEECVGCIFENNSANNICILSFMFMTNK